MKKNFGSLLLLLISSGQIFINIVKAINEKDLVDFLVYKQALGKFFSGLNVYQYLYSLPLDKIPFNYPPSTLIILSPLNFLPTKTGEIIITFVSLFLLVVSLFLTMTMVKIKISFFHFLIVTSFFIQTFPVKFTLILGQINLVVLGLIMISLYLYFKFKKNKLLYIISIIIFSLSAALKIFPIFMLPVFLILGDFVFPITVLVFFALFNFMAGYSLVKEYFLKIVLKLTKTIPYSMHNQSLAEFFARLGINSQIAKSAATGFLLLIMTYVLYRFIKEKNRLKLAPFYLFLIMAICSFNNLFSWQHHLVFSYPLIFYLYLMRSKKISWKNILFFLIIWGFFVFHFRTANDPLLNNPFLASYQTIALIFLVFYSLKENPVY